MSIVRYSDLRKDENRAQQIYLVLLGFAKQRKTLTYGDLTKILGFGADVGWARKLTHIQCWCEENDLPALNYLVVSKGTGAPGDGLETKDWSAENERIFAMDWFDIVPPEPSELKAAYDRAQKAKV